MAIHFTLHALRTTSTTTQQEEEGTLREDVPIRDQRAARDQRRKQVLTAPPI
jgi:hypothetical protein